MPFSFPPAPHHEGLTYLGLKPVFFRDRHSGQRIVFPVYSYREDDSGELILVTEDCYEGSLDRLIEMGAFGAKGSRA